MSRFRTTLWPLIAQAARGDAGALERFVQQYRAPVLVYLRRRGFDADDAEDLAQEAFTLLLEKDLLARADPARGRFRSYLLGILRHVIADHVRRDAAARRGGGWRRVPLEAAALLAAAEADPEFDAAWFEGLLQSALAQLERENPRQHEVMRLQLGGDRSHKAIGEALGRTAAQVKTDLHRARERLVRAVKRDIASYAGSEEEYREELRLLLRTLGGQDPKPPR